jgi:hypothetical protein
VGTGIPPNRVMLKDFYFYAEILWYEKLSKLVWTLKRTELDSGA